MNAEFYSHRAREDSELYNNTHRLGLTRSYGLFGHFNGALVYFEFLSSWFLMKTPLRILKGIV